MERSSFLERPDRRIRIPVETGAATLFGVLVAVLSRDNSRGAEAAGTALFLTTVVEGMVMLLESEDDASNQEPPSGGQ